MVQGAAIERENKQNPKKIPGLPTVTKLKNGRERKKRGGVGEGDRRNRKLDVVLIILLFKMNQIEK